MAGGFPFRAAMHVAVSCGMGDTIAYRYSLTKNACLNIIAAYCAEELLEGTEREYNSFRVECRWNENDDWTIVSDCSICPESVPE